MPRYAPLRSCDLCCAGALYQLPRSHDEMRQGNFSNVVIAREFYATIIVYAFVEKSWRRCTAALFLEWTTGGCMQATGANNCHPGPSSIYHSYLVFEL